MAARMRYTDILIKRGLTQKQAVKAAGELTAAFYYPNENQKRVLAEACITETNHPFDEMVFVFRNYVMLFDIDKRNEILSRLFGPNNLGPAIILIEEYADADAFDR